MKPKKAKTFVIHNSTWFYNLIVRVGGTIEETDRYLSRRLRWNWTNPPPEGTADVAVCLANPDQCDHAIWFSSPPTPDVLAHEALHSVFHVMRRKGVQVSEESEEAFTYLLTWTVFEVGRRIWKR